MHEKLTHENGLGNGEAGAACEDTETIMEFSPVSVALLLLMTGLLIAAFWENLSWLVTTWGKDEFYSHGFIIPLISGYLIFRKWPRLRELPRQGAALGLVVVFFGILLHFIGTFLDIHFVSSFAFIVVVFGLVWWIFGKHIIAEVAFPLLFLFFMVPLGKLLIDQVAQPMQLFGAKLAGETARALGMQLVIEGTSLITPEYTFEVAVACSGLKSAIAMLALGALLAYLVKAPWWKRVLLFASSLPVAIVANAARIWVTTVMGRSLGAKMATGFAHEFSGMLVFLLAFLGLFGMTVLLKCTELRDDL